MNAIGMKNCSGNSIEDYNLHPPPLCSDADTSMHVCITIQETILIVSVISGV